MKEFIFTRFVELFRAPKRLLIIIGIITGAAIFIWHQEPYIDIPGNLIKFQLPSFHYCSIHFQDPINVANYKVIKTPDGKNPKIQNDTNSIFLSLDVFTNNLEIANSYEPVIYSGTGTRIEYTVEIDLKNNLSSKISTISVDGKEIKLGLFYEHFLKTSRQEMVTEKHIRTTLANVITKLNDRISNYILTILAFGIAVFIPFLMTMECKLFVYSQASLRTSMSKANKNLDLGDSHSCQELFSKCAAEWYERHSWFRFFQILGPAVGFILTVSSLIAALNPANHEANDLNAFMTGIHVAMVATFLGLLLRILAIEASRVNDALLDKIETALLSNFENK